MDCKSAKFQTDPKILLMILAKLPPSLHSLFQSAGFELEMGPDPT